METEDCERFNNKEEDLSSLFEGFFEAESDYIRQYAADMTEFEIPQKDAATQYDGEESNPQNF